MGRRTLVLVVALLLAAVAAFAVFRFMSGVEAQAEPGRASGELLPRRRADPGRNHGGTSQSELHWRAGADRPWDSPPTAIASEAQLMDTLTGKIAAGPISQGQVITTEQWVPPNAGNQPLSAQSAKDFRR